MPKMWIILALLFAAGTVFRLFRPQIKGWSGETLLHALLKRKLDRTKYKILHDIMLPTPDGTTTQIDHIVVSQWGVFVIETKTYSGWIFGDAQSPQWTVTHFRRKDKFQNPLRQNYKHLATLSDCLGIPKECFKTIVAFSGEAVFKTEMPEEVMLIGNVPGYILAKSATPLFAPGQVPEIAEAILEWQDSLSHKRKAAHVENLRKNHPDRKVHPVLPPQRETGTGADDSNPPLCPKCGAEMVRRTRKSDSGAFWGCPNFPKCRGILQ